jgi:hypothetical protein
LRDWNLKICISLDSIKTISNWKLIP